MTSLVLIGFMGAGKTTISKKLAARLDQPVIDMDDYLVQQLGCSIEQYFAIFGEAVSRPRNRSFKNNFTKKGSDRYWWRGCLTERKSGTIKTATSHLFKRRSRYLDRTDTTRSNKYSTVSVKE